MSLPIARLLLNSDDVSAVFALTLL